MPVYQDKDKNGKIIKTKDGRSWYFKTYKSGKQCKSRKFSKKSEAENEEALFKLKSNKLYNKTFHIVAKDYFDYKYKTRKEATIYGYENIYDNHIKPFFEHTNINKIDISIIREWHEELDNKPYSLKYKNKIYTVLSSILNFAMKNYNLEKNYAQIYGGFESPNDEIIKDNEKLKYITYEEFNTFYSAIDNLLWQNFFTFLYYTGMRLGEVQALTWNDIDFNKSEIIVNKTLSTKTKNKNKINESNIVKYKTTNTKNRKNRIIKMNDKLKDKLLNYKKEVIKYTDFSNSWFVFGNSRFLPETTINRYRTKYFKLSGVSTITNHEFRHSHVSLLINEYIKVSKEKNMKIDTAKFFLMMADRMGHTIQVMQKTYMHLFPTIQDEIVDLLNNL